ncbi:glycosyltransferase [Candidatus Dojkabacteria bacterium]|jgi:glycosyltransferase involved in cell wall biosynthesis|nr:glycosyltransferase [Candidatus Dojkabacteria bacterium]
MKVIIDARTTQDEIKYNGVGRYSRFIIEHLISDFPETRYELIMYDSDSTLDEFFKKERNNVRIIRIGKYNQTGFMHMILHNLDLVFHIRLTKALLKTNRKDAVFLSLYFWRGLPVLLVPTVASIHDFALPRYGIYSAISPIHNFLRFIHYWYEILRVYFCKAVICDSDFTRADIKKYFPLYNLKNVHTVNLGIEEDKESTDFKKYLPEDFKIREYLIYLGGALGKNKNSKGVVNGYAEFVKKLEKEGAERNKIPYLIISGKNFTDEVSREAKSFRRYVESTGINDLVWFTGYYDDNSRFPLVRNSFGYIHLSLLEGFGFGVAEAMRARVPVIAHKGSSYMEVVKDGGVLLNGENPEKVGLAIYKIYKDRRFANDIAQKGFEISKQYDWKITAKVTHDILSHA